MTGLGKTFTMANVIAAWAARPSFCAQQDLAAQLYSEFREFFPKNAVEYFVSYYDYYQPEAYVPQRDLFIEKDSAINEHIEQMRLSLHQEPDGTARRGDRRHRVGHLRHWRARELPPHGDDAARGDKLGQRDVIAQPHPHAVPAQRSRFQRGGVPRARRHDRRVSGRTPELAMRIELFDDEIESLQLFDPLTGRVKQKIPRFTVYPSSHYVTPRQGAGSRGDHQAGAGRAPAATGFDGKLVEAQRLEQRTRFDLEMLSEVGHRKGIENYTRHLSVQRRETAQHADRLHAQNAIMFLDESHQMIGQLGHVQRRPRAQDHAGGIWLSPAVGAGQPAAQVRGI